MEYKRFGNKYVVRLEKGEEVVATIKKLCQKNNIWLGTIAGIGAVNKATVGLFETATKEYHSQEFSGDMEITNLTGNISTKDGDIYLHLHATLATSDLKTYGGHLNEAVISATGEVFIDAIAGKVERQFSDEIGLNLLKF